MSSTLRRLSSSIPFIKNNNNNNTTDSNSTTSIFRRKSSSASSSSTDDNGTFRSLGARDYKLAMDPEEEKGRRRSSVTEYVADMAAAELAAQTAERDGKRDGEVVVVRKGSVGTGSGRVYGARDWRLIGKD